MLGCLASKGLYKPCMTHKCTHLPSPPLSLMLFDIQQCGLSQTFPLPLPAALHSAACMCTHIMSGVCRLTVMIQNAGLAVVTAEREDARRRAEQAEFEMRELRAECKSLVDRLQAQSASMQPIDSELSRSQVDSAPAQAPDSPPSQAPTSTQGDSSELNATELTRQLEEAAVKTSSLEADIVSLHAQVVTRNVEFESSRAALSTELALMTQQIEQLSSQRDQATQRVESSFAERDSFAKKTRELETELAESTLRTESLSAEKVELKQQLEGLLAGAEQTSEAQDEVQKLQGQLSQLQEQLQHKKEEVRRLEEEQGQLHQKVHSLEEEAQESFEQLTGKEEVSML